MPWSADNFDLSVERYTEGGGLLSAGVFLKELRDFFGDALGNRTRRDAPRLGMANHLAVLTASQQQGHLRELGGFPRPCFTAHDDDLVRQHGRHDVVTALAHGQVWRKGNLQS